MRITLINKKKYDTIMGIYEKYPALTYQNKGYDTLDKSKLTEEEKEAFEQITIILRQHVDGFSYFNNFKVRDNGSVVLRFQYNYGADDPDGQYFIGVGYLPVIDLHNGFVLKKKDAESLMREGVKITHDSFAEGTWMTIEGRKLLFNDGHTAWEREFWADRTGKEWETGYRRFYIDAEKD